jgi:hypothetical protein
MGEDACSGLPTGMSREFTTTHWSVVLNAGQQESPHEVEEEIQHLIAITAH